MVRKETYKRLIATSENAKLLMTSDDFIIITNEGHVTASHDINAFCQTLVNTWPVPSSESFRWMIRRLKGKNAAYSNAANGLAATACGVPVNIFGHPRKGRYKPIDDRDNLIDVLSSIRQTYKP